MVSKPIEYQWCSRCDYFMQYKDTCPKCDETSCIDILVRKSAYDQAIKERDSYKAKAEKLTEALRHYSKKYEYVGKVARQAIKEHGVGDE